MTDLFKQAVETVAKLPDDDQDRIALMMLSSAQGKRQLPDDFSEPVAFEAIRDLLGVAEGPGDLSTNPKYMEGFGQRSKR